MTGSKEHWEQVYAGKRPDEVSWYQARPGISLELIALSGTPKEGNIIDVGGGASSLADYLLDAGFTGLTVLDISGKAIEYARDRLGDRACLVYWIEADITKIRLDKPVDLWHDRAVFHFLTEKPDRDKYVDSLRKTLKPAGHLILASFAPDGPEKCSGLPVCRYDAALIKAALGADFELIREVPETHITPWDAGQNFRYFLFKYAPV